MVDGGNKQGARRRWGVSILCLRDYVTVCFVPDPASGKAHAELGMITPFTVHW